VRKIKNLKKEIWKEIKEYTDYSISNYGRIKSFKKNKNGKILKLYKNNDGYFCIKLYKNNKSKTFKIHNIVANEFIPNQSNNLYEINHIDENKENNYFENLEWCDRQYNIEYSKSKSYKILFPDGHEEIIFNLNKFCKESQLNQGSMNRTFKKGYFHKGYKILEKIDKNGIISKSKESYLKKYKILYPNGKIEIINNLRQFCILNNLDQGGMQHTFKKNNFHKGFKIIDKIILNI
jgi:hypothetical protein